MRSAAASRMGSSALGHKCEALASEYATWKAGYDTPDPLRKAPETVPTTVAVTPIGEITTFPSADPNGVTVAPAVATGTVTEVTAAVGLPDDYVPLDAAVVPAPPAGAHRAAGDPD